MKRDWVTFAMRFVWEMRTPLGRPVVLPGVRVRRIISSAEKIRAREVIPR